jgi:predicted ATPase
MERAIASGYPSSLTDGDAAIVAAMCSRLDGIALAIELAASNVGAFGLRGTADMLNNRLRLLWQGRRSAPPRQQTLRATLDWSFNLLSDRDRCVLCRLSIFVGVFTLEAAQAVATDNQIDAVEVAAAITSLIHKSLVSVAFVDGTPRHRLLDSTQVFAAEKLVQTGEANAVARRHALYFAEWCRGRSATGVAAADDDAATLGPNICNIRSALEWSFSSVGDAIIGVRLAAVAAPLFLKLSLLVECCRWCMQALAAFPDTPSDQAARMALLEALAVSAMFTRGNNCDVRKTIEDALGLAETLGDHWRQLQLLSGLYIFMIRTGDLPGSMAAAQHRTAIARKIDAPAAIATGEWMLGLAFHLIGDQASALRHLQYGMTEDTIVEAEEADLYCSNHRIRALVGLARVLWLSGFPDQARTTAQQAIDAAVRRDHSVDLCITLAYLAPVFLWCGELDEAEQLIRRLVAHAARHSFDPYHALGEAFTGELAIARGDLETGVLILRRALGRLQAERYHTLMPSFQRALAEGLMQCGKIDEAAVVLDAALAPSEAGAEAVVVPELLRIRGELWLLAKPAEPAAAERAFQLALQRAKAQSALSLELRSAMGLARLWSSQGKCTDAVDLLADIYRRFTEGYHTTDLKLARQLLSTLERSAPSLAAVGKPF